MENEVRRKLVVELYKKMQIAKVQGGIKKPSVENDLFLKLGGFIIPEDISRKNYFQIAQFYVFLKENPDLTKDEIREILKSNNKFSFLRKLDVRTPDLFEELKLHGPMVIAIDYASRQHFHEQLEKKLP